MGICVEALSDDLAFGARISGVDHDVLADPAARAEINAVFEDRGVVVFEDIEPSGQMHVALSNVFGPLKEHPVKAVARVDTDTMPGVIDMNHDPAISGIVEFGGKRLSSWLPWHFDHCYNNELNRAGVLRAITIAPEGGMTGFVDGIQLYEALSPDLRAAIEGHDIIYTLNLCYKDMKFGLPPALTELREPKGAREMTEAAKSQPRALHPAVWTRTTGEKVLHVSPWMAEGISGDETRAGDDLLEAVCQEINAKAVPYFHRWKPTDMLIWDNWRMLHSVSGTNPEYPRRMQRTTIKGDYGLGRFEDGRVGDKMLEMTV